MSFVLEVSKNGKDFIIFKNYKFRESYSLKIGDIVWRCLGKNCKVSLKTNKDKPAIYSCIGVHSGPHPVTMRALTPTPSPMNQQLRQSTSATALSDCSLTPTSAIANQENTSSTMLNESALFFHEGTDCVAEIKTTPSKAKDLEIENGALRLELAALREEKRIILDHSIESDQRLLQFTSEVFLPPVSPPAALLPFGSASTPSTRECGVQSDPQTACDSEHCDALRDLVTSLRTTISVLEAEVELLRAEAAQRHYEERKVSAVCGGDIKLSNNMESEKCTDIIPAFTVMNKKKVSNINKNPTDSKSNNVHKRKKIYRPTYESDRSCSVPFNNVTVMGDSHVRNLAGNIQNRVKGDVLVSGVCKPGAGLLAMTPTTAPAGDHCYVLMAGSNDVDAGREDVMFSRLEHILHSCRGSKSSILLIPLPTRYDLSPENPIHRTVDRVNNYMAEVCQRLEGIQLLDISSIRREHHTRHGLHLRTFGKRILAGLIVRKLSTMTVGRQLRHAQGTVSGVAGGRPSQSPVGSKTYSAVAAGKTTTLQRPSLVDCPPKSNFLEKM